MVLVTLLWTLLLRLSHCLFPFRLYSLNLPCTFILPLPFLPALLALCEAQAFLTLEPPVLDGALGQVVPPHGLFLINSVSKVSLRWADTSLFLSWGGLQHSLRYFGNRGGQKVEAGACPSIHLLIHCSFTQRSCKWMQHTHLRWIFWRL